MKVWLPAAVCRHEFYLPWWGLIWCFFPPTMHCVIWNHQSKDSFIWWEREKSERNTDIYLPWVKHRFICCICYLVCWGTVHKNINLDMLYLNINLQKKKKKNCADSVAAELIETCKLIVYERQLSIFWLCNIINEPVKCDLKIIIYSWYKTAYLSVQMVLVHYQKKTNKLSKSKTNDFLLRNRCNQMGESFSVR